VAGKWTRRGKAFSASVPTGGFFDARPEPPVRFDVRFEGIRRSTVVLPSGRPTCERVCRCGWEVLRLDGEWLSLEAVEDWGGAIIGLTEKGRGRDHFSRGPDLIQDVVEAAGHTDRVNVGWDDKSRGGKAGFAGWHRRPDAVALSLEGPLDEGLGLRTRVTYQLMDDFPLVLLDRSYVLRKPEKKDKDEGEEKPPATAIDDVNAVQVWFRAAWRPDDAPPEGSRIVWRAADRLETVRAVQALEHFRDWTRTIADGWVVVEHPVRGECLMYLFPVRPAPHLASCRGPGVGTLAPGWAGGPIGARGGTGYTLALCPGEIYGAGAGGAWVASRRPTARGVECACIARVRPGARGGVTFELGRAKREVAPRLLTVPGLGEVLTARAEFRRSSMDRPFTARLGRIAQGRES
jgi:hypothetical protein